jgi:hypothetical protein
MCHLLLHALGCRLLLLLKTFKCLKQYLAYRSNKFPIINGESSKNFALMFASHTGYLTPPNSPNQKIIVAHLVNKNPSLHLRNQSVHCRIFNSARLVPILCQMNPALNTTIYLRLILILSPCLSLK